MDASPLFDPEYLPVILGTLIGFGLLAALLLFPVSWFLDREQEVAEDWTPEVLAERLRKHRRSTSNGRKTGTESQSSSGEDSEPDPRSRGDAPA